MKVRWAPNVVPAGEVRARRCRSPSSTMGLSRFRWYNVERGGQTADLLRSYRIYSTASVPRKARRSLTRVDKEVSKCNLGNLSGSPLQSGPDPGIQKYLHCGGEYGEFYSLLAENSQGEASELLHLESSKTTQATQRPCVPLVQDFERSRGVAL